MRGRQEEGPGVHRTLEWIGRDDAGEAIARVVRVVGPVWAGWPASAARWWGAPPCRSRRCAQRRRRSAGTDRTPQTTCRRPDTLVWTMPLLPRRQHGSPGHQASAQGTQGKDRRREGIAAQARGFRQSEGGLAAAQAGDLAPDRPGRPGLVPRSWAWLSDAHERRAARLRGRPAGGPPLTRAASITARALRHVRAKCRRRESLI